MSSEKVKYVRPDTDMTNFLLKENQKLRDRIVHLEKTMRWIQCLTRDSFAKDMVDKIEKKR